ncbi:hypothetical protein E2C01_075236 [Portunus trituberculatus]|uniref:Uncharacterized protein n=1 Tax=Portunus trituberculatus TaxID=210409 RepID=A0A5B7I809_PORTR|nr:hypothetical protein [Portunus trituberculatus]
MHVHAPHPLQLYTDTIIRLAENIHTR